MLGRIWNTCSHIEENEKPLAPTPQLMHSFRSATFNIANHLQDSIDYGRNMFYASTLGFDTWVRSYCDNKLVAHRVSTV